MDLPWVALPFSPLAFRSANEVYAIIAGVQTWLPLAACWFLADDPRMHYLDVTVSLAGFFPFSTRR
jgi:hypothetical protein